MGLLDKIDAMGENLDSDGIKSFIADFFEANHSFHCMVLKCGKDPNGLSAVIEKMAGCYGIACKNLPDGDCIALLPGGLDLELFSHRISKSTGSTVVFQFSADSPSLAFETLHSYLP